MECIVKKDLMDYLRITDDDNVNGGANLLWALLYSMMDNFETIDAVPVVHGRWEYSRTTADGFDLVKCTRCGFEPYAISHFVREGNFCPNCGADMREKGGCDDN